MFVRVRRTFEQTNIDLGDELKNIRTLNNRTFENHRTFKHAKIRANEHPNTRTFEHLRISEHSNIEHLNVTINLIIQTGGM